MAQDKAPTVGIIGPVRLSYLSAFKPRLNNAKTPPELEYGALLLIPKETHRFCPNPDEVLSAIRTLVKNAGGAKFGKSAYKAPLKDGDKIEEGETEPRNPGFWTLRVSCKAEYPPVLLDGTGTPTQGGWESGDWGKVKINAWTYDRSGNKGVSCGLWAIQFLYKDEPLGNSNSPAAVAAEFGTVEGADKPIEALAGVGSGQTSEDEFDPFADE